MWAPTVSSTTSRARCLAALSVAEFSPVRRALRYASTARTRGFITMTPFCLCAIADSRVRESSDPCGQALGGDVLLFHHLVDDEVERAALRAVRQVLDLDFQLAHVEVVLDPVGIVREVQLRRVRAADALHLDVHVFGV